jgi:hypothetical protein
MDMLEVTVTKCDNGYMDEHQSWVSLPDEEIYHQVITERDFVHWAYALLDEQPMRQSHGMIWLRPAYVYRLRLEVDGKDTLLYGGLSNVGSWGLKTVSERGVLDERGIGNPEGTPVRALMEELHTRFDMPLFENGGWRTSS